MHHIGCNLCQRLHHKAAFLHQRMGKFQFGGIEQDGCTVVAEGEQQVNVYAAHLKGTLSYDEPDYKKKTAFLIGNEGNGLSDEIADLADTYIKIPMQGQVESLNAAISASLLMYETGRQRRH